MSKRMLIDASHPEETRVVVLDGHKVEEFDFESASKRPLKGNIYLAKVTRVEPSLQAAFVEYGGNRQGFLAFSEIHPDYYQIPVADRLALLAAQTQRMMAEDEFDSVDIASAPAQESLLASEDGEKPAEETSVESMDASETGTGDEESLRHDEQAATTAEENSHAAAEQQGADQAGSSHMREEAEDEAAPADLDGATTPSAEGAERATEEVSGESGPGPDTQAEATGAPQPFQRRERGRPPRRRQYKIQEVIKRRQILLVQVVKEERGNKGASLTTFLSLAGRYCVLMPNTPRGGGISRKITSATDRKRLKSAAQSLELPQGMGLIIRTAGANRTKAEIKRDYEYLLRLWDSVRELTLKSNAPALVYEEGSLIKRAIRDLYNKDIAEVLVDGDSGYREAKEFMRMLMPSHAKNVKLYKEALPLFQRYHVESQLDAMFSPVVQLKSGGYIVINQTEALVAIDVNSGKATREHSIEETAHKTNLEAADEIARQLRLRDLAGLIVIDFIDMEDSRNDRSVEKRLHNAVRGDRARVQIGKISHFGLLEMSRQRLRAGVLAGSTVTCPHCAGQGIIRSTESAALRLLRALDEEGQKNAAANVTVKAPEDVTIYTLNQKRRELARIEEAYDLAITFDPQTNMMGGSFEIERTGVRVPSSRPKVQPVSVEAGFHAPEEETAGTDVTIAEPPVAPAAEREGAGGEAQAQLDGQGKRRRRRRRRGGRGRGQPSMPEVGADTGAEMPAHRTAELESAGEQAAAATDEEEAESTPPTLAEGGGRKRRRRRGRRGRRQEGEPLGGGAEEARALEAVQEARSETHATREATEPLSEPVSEIVPNAPSSPQWSLVEAEPAHVAEEAATASSGPAPEPEPAQAPDQREEPRETRKGWWQRRFKM